MAIRGATSPRAYLGVARTLLCHGVTPSSVLMYPVRRRVAGRYNRLDLRAGVSLVSPREEPLVPMFEEVWIHQSYYPPRWRLPAGGTVIDIGANVGVFTVWAAIEASAKRIVAVEPSRRALGSLRTNIDCNGLAGVSILDLAVGGEARTATLFQRGPAARATLHRQDAHGSLFAAGPSVQVVTLGEVFRLSSLQRCDLLKLDCEGSEYEILLEASEDVLRRIDAIAAEYHEDVGSPGVATLTHRLRKSGFTTTCSDPLDDGTGYLYAVRHRQ